MPAENVCRAEHVFAEDIDKVLFPKRKAGKQMHLSVEIDDDGYASYLKHNTSLSVPFDNLRPDDRKQIIKVTVYSEIEAATKDSKLYLCRERPLGNIYLLRSELEHKENERLDANCVKKGEDCAELMPCSEIRTSIHLSYQLINVMRKYFACPEGQKNPAILRDRVSALLEEVGGKSRELGNVLFSVAKELAELKEYADTDSAVIKFKDEIPKIINRFMEQMDSVKNGVVQTSLVNAVFISGIAQYSDEDKWKEAGRNVYSIIQKNMKYYCCEEILLEKWFLFPEYSGLNLRTLLDSVYLGGVELTGNGYDDERTDKWNGTLTVKQVEKIRNVCEIILRRNRDIESDGLVETALCLLEVSGQMKDYPLYEDTLREAVEKTKCYAALGGEKEGIDLIEHVVKLHDDNIFNCISIHEPFAIYNILIS